MLSPQAVSLSQQGRDLIPGAQKFSQRPPGELGEEYLLGEISDESKDYSAKNRKVNLL